MRPYDISSLSNQRIKQVIKLRNRRQRDAARLTLVEGMREVSRALDAGVWPREVFICPDLLDAAGKTVAAQLEQLAIDRKTQVFRVTTAVYEKLVYREASGGILLVIPYQTHALNGLRLGKTPFLAVIDGVEKPGNLGAILRAADGAGVDALIVSDESGGGTDIHNPNTIRASLGALFSVPVAATTPTEAVAWLRSKGIQIVATTPDAKKVYTAVDLTQPTAIIMGSEAFGLGQTWLNAADQRVQIPMSGQVDSLNLAVATALLLYETQRQRSSSALQLDHFVLTVRDIDATCFFYRDVLGMKAAQFGDGRVALHFGAQKINLHQAGQEFEPKAAVATPGSADFCLITPTPLAEVMENFQMNGVKIVAGPLQRTGAAGTLLSIYLRDPDGNLIEIANRQS